MSDSYESSSIGIRSDTHSLAMIYTTPNYLTQNVRDSERNQWKGQQCPKRLGIWRYPTTNTRKLMKFHYTGARALFFLCSEPQNPWTDNRFLRTKTAEMSSNGKLKRKKRKKAFHSSIIGQHSRSRSWSFIRIIEGETRLMEKGLEPFGKEMRVNLLELHW